MFYFVILLGHHGLDLRGQMVEMLVDSSELLILSQDLDRTLVQILARQHIGPHEAKFLLE